MEYKSYLRPSHYSDPSYAYRGGNSMESKRSCNCHRVPQTYISSDPSSCSAFNKPTSETSPMFRHQKSAIENFNNGTIINDTIVDEIPHNDVPQSQMTSRNNGVLSMIVLMLIVIMILIVLMVRR
jgi:hypothetical protein